MSASQRIRGLVQGHLTTGRSQTGSYVPARLHTDTLLCSDPCHTIRMCCLTSQGPPPSCFWVPVFLGRRHVGPYDGRPVRAQEQCGPATGLMASDPQATMHHRAVATGHVNRQQCQRATHFAARTSWNLSERGVNGLLNQIAACLSLVA
jgi:hypothetical protein